MNRFMKICAGSAGDNAQSAVEAIKMVGKYFFGKNLGSVYFLYNAV